MFKNIVEFEKSFEENYKMLYQSDFAIKDYNKKLENYNKLVKKDEVKELLKQFILHRGDFISSDRECVAFVLTLENYMLKEN